MRKTNNLLKIIFGLLIFITLALNINYSFAAIIRDENGNPVPWNDIKAKDAYRPSPILFVHGFASGGPLQTWVERQGQREEEKPKLDEKLRPYFEYYTGYNNDPTILQDTRIPYLELISFIDFSKEWRGQLIDRNSSVDTYLDTYVDNKHIQDYYVAMGERHGVDSLFQGVPADELARGWSDKLTLAIDELRKNYKDKNGFPQKIILVCHSMGGLAAREYLTNTYDYLGAGDTVKAIILIGVPNLGSPWAKLADGLTKAQRIGWFIPGAGWIFSSGIEVFDKIVEHRGMVDIDGDAVRDMDTSSSGSGYLGLLNSRPQPLGVDYFALWGNGNSLTDILISRQLYDGEGDGVVSKDSQLGTGILNLKDFDKIDASHGNEALAIANSDVKPLLKFIDDTKPEVVITSPGPTVIPVPEINTLSINLKGTISKEYLPADCILKIEATREEDGQAVEPREGKFLYPSDLWDPNDPNSVVAEFDEKFEFTKPGTYTISVIVTNPRGFVSDTKTTRVKVTIQKPVIYIQAPASKITDLRPLIKARIYSPDNINIDLSSIELRLDGTIVTHTVTVETGGSDIIISYTPINDLSVNNPNTSGINEGKHAIVINAKDKIGLVADEKNLTFEIFILCPPEIVKYVRAINEREKTVGLTQTKFYNRTTGASLGNPDGGINVPSSDALSNYPFLSKYIDDIRLAIKRIMDNQDEYLSTGAYWDINSDTKWTFASLYKAAMNTSGTGPGLDTWTHTYSQMVTNGIETIDIEEIQKCILKIEALRLPVRGVSSIANYLWYTIVDYGVWNESRYAPDGIGDSFYYPSELRFGDQGQEVFPTRYNSSVRAFFGGNIKNFSNLILKEATLYISVAITEGNPASLGNCHLGHFLPNVNAADFQKSVEAEIATVPITNGTFAFTVTNYIRIDINNGKGESWYKGWFDNLTDYSNDWDRLNWWPIKFIISPSFQNP